jgi:excinuclease ABC subunit C
MQMLLSPLRLNRRNNLNSFDPKSLEKYSIDSGVYLMKNAAGKVIYVGKAKNIKVRLKQYFVPGRDERPMIPFLTAEVVVIDTIVAPNEKEALLLENTLIKKYQPKFNAILKDDKTFISLMITNKDPWPMIRLIRYKGKPKKNGLYFGPYTSAFAARKTFDLLTKLFPLRQCSDSELKRRDRPCILHSIKRCVAPCVQKCTKEEYTHFVQGAIDFLKGDDKKILKHLYAEMEKSSEAMEYEQAAAYHTTIKQIEHVIEGENSLVVNASSKETDVLGIYRQGDEVILFQILYREGKLVGSEYYEFSLVVESDEEILASFIIQFYQNNQLTPKEILIPLPLSELEILEEIIDSKLIFPQKGEKKALLDIAYTNAKAAFNQHKDHAEIKEKMLLELQEKLKLTRFPERIECFDISNISGSDIVASMVAFTRGEKDRKRTRLFKIKGQENSDDYSAMRQVLTRRLYRAREEEDLPDLIIVDGGKGQLGIAVEVLKELNLVTTDVIALTKQEGRHDRGMTLERVFIPSQSDAIQLDSRSPLLFLLQKIRDETHDKAIEFHRKQRSKRTFSSQLDTIKGIGPIKRQRLLQHFGSFKQIQKASDEELLAVASITRKDIFFIRNPTA